MASDATKSHIFQQLFSIKILTNLSKLQVKNHHQPRDRRTVVRALPYTLLVHYCSFLTVLSSADHENIQSTQ